jgi:hypothetical protein
MSFTSPSTPCSAGNSADSNPCHSQFANSKFEGYIMTYPKNIKGIKICVVVSNNAIKIYGNREAFKSLADWMSWLGHSEASEHYDFHLTEHLLSDDALLNESKRNVWVVFEDGFVSSNKQEKRTSFDISFMVVEEGDLEKLKKKERRGP